MTIEWSQRLGDTSPQRIVIFRALPGLGDLLCVVPALRALRRAFPAAQVSLIGLPGACTFVERFHHYLDGFIEFPGFPGLADQPPQLEDIPPFLTFVQKQHFDLALQMHGNGVVSNAITTLSGARLIAGFYVPGQYCPNPDYFLPYEEDESEVQRYTRLMAFLGISVENESLEFPLRVVDWQGLAALKETYNLQLNSYICLHPGANTPERRWPPERFAVIGDILAARSFQIVLTGSLKERALTQSVAQMMKVKPVDLAGRTSLGTLAALLAASRLVICNDTGVSHLAAALTVPSVVIFTKSNPKRWAPLNRTLHAVVQPNSGPHIQGNNGLPLVSAMKEPAGNIITPEMVLAQAESLLRKELQQAA